MVSNTENRVCLSLAYKNRPVKVTLEFPEQSDPGAEKELLDGLKAVYLKRIENETGWKEAFGESAFFSGTATGSGEDKGESEGK